MDRDKVHPLAFDNPPDAILTQHFHQLLSSQIPHNFKISPLTRNILSWVIAVLQIHESFFLTQSRKAQMKPMTDAGTDGAPSQQKQDSVLASASLRYMSKKVSLWQIPLYPCTTMQTDIPMVPLKELVNARWLQKLPKRPQCQDQQSV
jgi:hypothetical protein